MRLIKTEYEEHVVFKIIPHSSVLNSATRRFQQAIYELLSSVSKREYPWQHRNGLHIIVRPKPDIWWITRMYTCGETKEDKQSQIEFYVCLPSSFVNAFKTKFNNFEQWRRSTLEEIPTFTFPDDNVDLYKLKYRHHDMFSLEFDYSQQNTPIRDIMGVVHELEHGEAIDIFIRCVAMSRRKWKGMADYAWDLWDKDKMPYRSGFDMKRLLHWITHAGTIVATEITNIIHDTLHAIERIMYYNPEESKERRIVRPYNRDREYILMNGGLSSRTRKKRNQPIFETYIRYVIKSNDNIRSAMLSRSIANAYASLDGDNRLEPIKINIGVKKELDNLRQWKIKDIDPNRMSIDEVGKLVQLPTKELQDEFHHELISNKRVEIIIPDAFSSSGILAGTTTNKGKTSNVYIPTADEDILFTPRVVIGSPRMGKDQHVINLIVEAKRKHSIGAIIPDVINERNGHRGMADAIRDHLPQEDVIDLDLSDTQYPIYLGLHDIVRNIPDYRIAADRIAEELTEFILADGQDDKIQTAHYLREASKIVNGDLLGIKLMFTSPSFRAQKMKEFADIFDIGIWEHFNRLSDGQRTQLYAPIMRRLGQLESEFMKPIFYQQPNPNMNLYEWVKEGKVVIFRIPTSQISERAVQILVHWIVLNVFLIKLSHGGRYGGTFLVLNEPHQFLSPGLVRFMERMLSEGAKYRLAPIIIFHHFSQFKHHPGFVDMMLASSMNWHLFKNTNHKVYDTLMPYLHLTFDSPQQAFEATKRFQYIACWLNRFGEYEPPFIVDALPLVSRRYKTLDNSHLTKLHNKIYGRPISEVLTEIKNRNKLAYI